MENGYFDASILHIGFLIQCTKLNVSFSYASGPLFTSSLLTQASNLTGFLQKDSSESRKTMTWRKRRASGMLNGCLNNVLNFTQVYHFELKTQGDNFPEAVRAPSAFVIKSVKDNHSYCARKA